MVSAGEFLPRQDHFSDILEGTTNVVTEDECLRVSEALYSM